MCDEISEEEEYLYAILRAVRYTVTIDQFKTLEDKLGVVWCGDDDDS